jgi:hypothetical protein
MKATRRNLTRTHYLAALTVIPFRSWKPASAGFDSDRAVLLRRWSTVISLVALASLWGFPAVASAQLKVTADP